MSDRRLKKTLILLIAAATFVGSVIVLFAVEAGGRAAGATRDSRLRGIAYLTFSGRELWALKSDWGRVASYRELEALRQVEEAYRLYRPAAESLPNVLAQERLAQALDALVDESGVFSSLYFDRATGRLDAVRNLADRVIEPSTRILQEEDREKTRAQYWIRKTNVYTTSLTVLAVAVFLLTLALSIPAKVRMVFAATGLALITGLVGFCLAARAEKLQLFSTGDIELLAKLSGRVFVAQSYGLIGDLERVIEEAGAVLPEADRLVRTSPRYTAAYALRGMARQLRAEAMFYRDGPGREAEVELEKALSDLERALKDRREDGPLTWSMAYGRFLAGKYEEALTYLRLAAERLPDQKLGLGLNEAVYLSCLGRSNESGEAFRKAVRQAAEQRRGSDPLYFRTVIRNIARLREIRAAPGLEGLEESVKEAFISVSTLGRAEPEAVKTSISPLTIVEPVYSEEGKIVELNERNAFPPLTSSVSYIFDHTSLEAGFETRQKVYWKAPGRVFWREQVHLAKSEKWSGKKDGKSGWAVDFPLPGAGRGLPAGLYRVEFYVQGNLLSRGEFTVR